MRKTILAVDDMPTTLTVISTIFLTDYQVIKKKNGLEALNWIKEGNLPDAIITDLKMPHMDGYEFIYALKANNLLRHIPILVLSGSENPADRVKCLKLGARDYLKKPFNPEELKYRTANMIQSNYFSLENSEEIQAVTHKRKSFSVLESLVSLFL